MKLGWKKIRGRLKNAVISRVFNRWYRHCEGFALKNHSKELKGWKPGKRSLVDKDLWKNRIVVFNKWWTDLGVYPMNFSWWFFGVRWGIWSPCDGFWSRKWTFQVLINPLKWTWAFSDRPVLQVIRTFREVINTLKIKIKIADSALWESPCDKNIIPWGHHLRW